MPNEFKENKEETMWDNLKLNEYKPFTEFLCGKCKSPSIEMFGAVLRWIPHKNRWHIANESETRYQCMDCDDQSDLKDAVRRYNLTRFSNYVRKLKDKEFRVSNHSYKMNRYHNLL